MTTSEGSDGFGRLAPGLVRVALLTSLAYLVAFVTGSYGIGAAAVGVVLGVIVANAWGVGVGREPGVRFVGRRVLALAVVFLGFQVDLRDVLALGWATLLLVLGVVSGALVVALLGARLMGLSSSLGALIGAGSGVCGASAIAAAAPAVGAAEEETTYAIAAITFLGSIGLLAYPLIQLAFRPFDVVLYGLWAGATLHSVPQAVGAGVAGGGDVGAAAATIVKLARVALLAGVVLGLGFGFRAAGAADAVKGTTGRDVRLLPVEVWGFVLASAVASSGVLPFEMLRSLWAVSDPLLVMALTALGLQTRFGALRATGAKPLGLALLVWVVLSGGVWSVLQTWS